MIGRLVLDEATREQMEAFARDEATKATRHGAVARELRRRKQLRAAQHHEAKARQAGRLVRWYRAGCPNPDTLTRE